jgi:comEA protein
MSKRIAEWLRLTKKEQKVILFLVLTLLFGAGIRLFQELFPSVRKFDYSRADSTFSELSLDPENTAVSEEEIQEENRKLNINIATREQLMNLPGIGSAIAERIIDYRKNFGKFSALDDLQKVKGIGKSKMDRIRPLISTQ